MSRLRIHFTDADIARTRIKLEIDLMWEVVSSAQILQHRDGALDFGAWRRRVHALAENDPDLRMALHTVVTVAPHADYFPDLLTQDVADIDEGIDAVLSVPSRRLRDEIDRILPAAGAAGSWLDDLANGRPHALRWLGDALRSYSRSAIEPHLPTIEDGLRADTAAGIQQYLHDGAEGLLNWLAGVPGGGAEDCCTGPGALPGGSRPCCPSPTRTTGICTSTAGVSC